MFEVTYDKEVVWELAGSSNTFRAQKYGLDYFNLLGDVNNDGIINVLDIVHMCNTILGAD